MWNLRRLFLVIASAAMTAMISLATVEAWLSRKYPQTCIVRHSILHHAFKPNCTFTERESEFIATYTINRYGQRGPDRPRVKPDGAFRILMLGDSFTEGSGVQDNETFSSLLEASLRDNDVWGGNVEVVNAGVRKYAPIIEYLYLKTDGLSFDPDLVIVNPNVTDLIKTDKFHQSVQNDTDGNLQAIVTPGRHFFPLTVRTWLWNHMRTYGYFQERVVPKLYQRYQDYRSRLARVFNRSQDPVAETSPQYFFSDHSVNMFSLSIDPQAYDKYGELRDDALNDYATMKQLLDERHIPMLAVIQPLELHVAPHEWSVLNDVFKLPLQFPEDYPVDERYHEDLKNFFQVENIPTLDLTGTFRTAADPKGERLFFPFDGHWTAKGHRIAAEEITRFILEWKNRTAR